MDDLPELETIADRIIVLRGQRVMLDVDLARLYGVETRRLNQQVRRNLARFPADFMLELSFDEWRPVGLQNATSLQRSKRRNVAPLAFTEHGCLMVANVLRSGRAVEVSVLIVRAFVRMRSALSANAELALRVEELSREVERHSGKLADHHDAIHLLLDEIRRLTQFPEEPKRGIGFTAPSLEREADAVVLPEWHLAEVRRRLAAFAVDGNPGRAADEVFAELKRRL